MTKGPPPIPPQASKKSAGSKADRPASRQAANSLGRDPKDAPSKGAATDAISRPDTNQPHGRAGGGPVPLGMRGQDEDSPPLLLRKPVGSGHATGEEKRRSKTGGGNGKSGDDRAKTLVFKPVRTSRQFGRFQLLMEMAHGGMATLFLGRIQGPEQFERLVAIKKIHDHLADEAEFIDMFLDEARITALIHHPNVATVFDLGQVEGAYFIAMEYIHGENLTAVLRASARQRRRLPWEFAARIVADAAAGLHAAHEIKGPDGKPLGVVHRDVSPQNILVSYDGHVKVVDFGIAFAAERISHTTAGTLKGKVSYMSPEQTMRGQVDRRSDVFSLGIILFEAVCLKRLFREESEAAALLRVREADVPKPRSIRPDIPPELERIILKALAKNPEDRYQTAEELEEALNKLLVSRGKVVGPPQIAKLMERLFYDKKKLKDEQIHKALESTEGAPIEAFGMAGTTGTKLEMPEGESSLSRAQQRPAWVVPLAAGSALLAGAVLILALVVWTKKGPVARAPSSQPLALARDAGAGAPKPRSHAARPDAGVAKALDAAVQQVTIKIVVRPERSRPVVEFRGKKYVGSVFQTSLVRSTKPETVRVEAKGYRTEILTLVPVEDKEIILTLKPKHRPARKPRSDHLMNLPD